MKERPILFNGQMVRAILDGRKTQTRRVVKRVIYKGVNSLAPTGWWASGLHYAHDAHFKKGYPVDYPCPYGQPGDRLWVRETYTMATGNGVYPVYRADAAEDDSGERSGFWIGEKFEVTGVRVERLQEIGPGDAYHEGAYSDCNLQCFKTQSDAQIRAFANLWDSVADAEFGWAANPWVWVVEFKRVKP